MARPPVSVVIPSWNSANQLAQNLPSVYTAADRVQAEIIVVDDGSRLDRSIEVLKAQGSKIRFYQNQKNQGFAYTVNRGVRLAHGQIVILLNTDVRPSPSCFTNCLRQFKDPAVFAVTFNSGQGGAGGKWSRGLMVHFPLRPRPHSTSPEPSLWASGGHAAFDRRRWLELGGMDLLYRPFYWEDVDLGYRAWKRGWKIVWDPASRCVHAHQDSVIASHYSPAKITSSAQRNQFLFVWKNIHDPRLLLSHLVHLPLFLKSFPSAFLSALPRLLIALAGRALEKQQSVLTDREVFSLWQSQ